MTLYVLKSSLCLCILFGFYKLFLENEKLHQFNRIYLLFSLFFSFVIPFLSFNVHADFIPLIEPAPVQLIDQNATPRLEADGLSQPSAYTLSDWLTGAYWLVTVVLLLRFTRNIVLLGRTVSRHPKILYQNATLVLLPGNDLPHTFLHYLFVSKTAYEKRAIEPELFTHELAHIRQKHSVDILLVELMICLFWFNPILILIKQAIRLNHEFLADERVNHQCRDVIHYQHLLLSKLTMRSHGSLTSNLTFQTTKQRFMMMTKQTSRTRALLIRSTTAVLFAVLTMVLCTKVKAQSPTTITHRKPQVTTRKTQPETDTNRLEQQYNDKLVMIPSGTTRVVKKKFSALSQSEKENVIFIAPQPYKTPAEAQFVAWKNPKKFGIWLDGKHIKNEVLNAYKPADIASYSGSYIHKNARQPQGYSYQIDLMTHAEYERYLTESAESPFLVLIKNRTSTKRNTQERLN